jgi:hypothetical protein
MRVDARDVSGVRGEVLEILRTSREVRRKADRAMRVDSEAARVAKPGHDAP